MFRVWKAWEGAGERQSSVARRSVLGRPLSPSAVASVVALGFALVVVATPLWGAVAVLQSYQLVAVKDGWQLRLAFEGDPRRVRIEESVAGVVSLELRGCRAVAEVDGQGLASGPLSAVLLEHKKRSLVVELKLRRPLEHTLFTSAGSVVVGFRAAQAEEQRQAQGEGAAFADRDALISQPSASTQVVAPMARWAEKVEVAEPLTTVDTAAYSVEGVAVDAPLAQRVGNRLTADLVDQLQGWAAAWREQEVEDYLAFYSASFKPAGGGDRQGWAVQRQQRLGRPQFIDVQLGQIEIHMLGRGHARCAFWQAYRSDTFSDRVHKILTWAEEDGMWKIVTEQVGF